MNEYVKESKPLTANNPKNVAELPPEEIKPRMEAALKRAFTTPPKTQNNSKLNKTPKA